MVPEGWERVELGQLTEFRNGLNFTKTSDGRELRVVGIPHFWQRTQITDFSGIDKVVVDRCTDNDLLQSGDLLFVRSNGNKALIGRCLLFPVVDEPVSFSGFTIRGRVDRKRLLPQHLCSLAETKLVRDQFQKGGGGTNISNLSQAILSSVEIPLPPLPEQKKIAEILGTWDRAIEVAEKQLKNAEAQKRALMQHLLTGTHRLKGFEGSEWKTVKLGDVAEVITKGTTPTSVGFDFKSEGINFIKAENINVDGVVRPSGTCISQKCDQALKRSRFSARDILVTIAGAIGRIGFVEKEILPANTNQAVAIVRIPPRAAINPKFAFYWLKGTAIQSIFRSSATTGAQPNISLKQLSGLPIQVPSLDEQGNIIRIMDDSAKLVQAAKQKLNHLRTEKRALMQQLLTGKKRVMGDVEAAL